MKHIIRSVIYGMLILSMGLAACTTSTPTPVPGPTSLPADPTIPPIEPTPTSLVEPTSIAEGEAPIYLGIIWHQHQPVYFKDPETGVYVKPWVRVHATKDYVDMAAMLEQYPDVKVTFNLTPSLIRQLDDLQAGAKDLYWTTAEVPADQLSEEQQQFLLERFFDTNRKIIARFPRYQELLEKRESGEGYTTQDFLDLQVLFNLAWTDPDYLGQEPLKGLVEQGRDFVESDKTTLFNEHERLISEVIPIHKKLQDSGQIEVTMTPFAHPILPLLVSTDLAKQAMPDAELPAKRFIYGQDAIEQVNRGVQLYEEHFAQKPRGMWPAEGSVAEEITNIVANAGIQWMASDEGVLANSLGFPAFTRDGKEVVSEADKLYRPYYVQGAQGTPVAMVFRDVNLSDKVGFQYSGMPGAMAAQDFIDRIHAIREALEASGAPGPHLVSVILDGENAWENYENDGKEFLNTLYELLSNDPMIKTVTPSEFLAIAPEQPMIENLWAGSWINHDFATWIGEEEENKAWEYLADTRAMLQKYINGIRQAPNEEALQQAITLMYIAEGSDWFWWYGADQNSGNDESFDQQYRDTLKQIYLTLGEEPPADLNVPIIPLRTVGVDQASSGLFTPLIDGQEEEGEWGAGGVYLAEGGVMAAARPYFESLIYGFDSKHLFLKVNHDPNYPTPANLSNVEIYLSMPGDTPQSNFSRGGSLLGFPANYLVKAEYTNGQLNSAGLFIAGKDGAWQDQAVAGVEGAAGGQILELAVALENLGKPETGDKFRLRAFYNESDSTDSASAPLDLDQLPGTGPAEVSVPDLGTSTVILDIQDPEKDDYGPGTYTYPKDAVFTAGSFDALNFQVSFDETNIIFKLTLRGPVENVWGSPNGLSIQTVDIYLDQDGDGQGGSAMLPGRNLALQAGFAWDFAITAEGWEPGIYTPSDQGAQKIATSSQFSVQTDPGQRKITIRVPKSLLGETPESWRYAALVLGQEGYPSSGVLRVRDVNQNAEQWRFGGAPADTNHTRVMDLIWPEAGQQEDWLSRYTASQAAQGDLSVQDFAQVAMLEVQPR